MEKNNLFNTGRFRKPMYKLLIVLEKTNEKKIKVNKKFDKVNVFIKI